MERESGSVEAQIANLLQAKGIVEPQGGDDGDSSAENYGRKSSAADAHASRPSDDSEQPGDGSPDGAAPPAEGGESGEIQSDAGELGADEGDEPDAPVSTTLADLAARLDVDVKDLYAVEIPLGSGQDPITLGELKDSAGEIRTLDAERESVAESRRENERDLLAARQELETVVGMLGDQVTPELVQLARQQRQALAEREAEKLMEVLPDWRDAETQSADRKAIGKMLSEYGFREAEIANVFDHRLLLFVRHAMQWRDQIHRGRESLADAKRTTKAKTATKKRSAAAAKLAAQIKQNRAREGSTEHKVGAISSLLIGQ